MPLTKIKKFSTTSLPKKNETFMKILQLLNRLNKRK